MAAPLVLTALAALAGLAIGLPGSPREGARSWDAGLRLVTRDARHGESARRSSSRLEFEFSPAGNAVDHYRIVAREQGGRNTRAIRVAADDRRAVFAGLPAATTFLVDITACLDAGCAQTQAATSNHVVSAATEEEIWQIQASGDTIESATRIVADGNVKIHATRFGPEAPAEVRGRVQIYYGPMSQATKGLAVGVSDDVATPDPRSVLRFESLAGQSGLISPDPDSSLVADVATGQAVPLASGVVRLFFEALGADGRTRIMHVDSQDGWIGRDFHKGPATVCATAADYSAGGPCAPTLDVAIASDPGGNPGFTDARQFKIGYPLQDDWRFHETPGTFMVITVSGATACSRAPRTTAYALWDGARWAVQYAANGCPKLFENIQAPMPVHQGGGRYKMYFGNPTEMTGVLAGSRLPWLGPKRVAYADAAATGDPDVVDFEDWEPLATARNVRFVWPSGRELTATEAGYLDDFVMLTPAGDPRVQVMYTAMTDGRIAPFATMAVLLNP